MKKVHDALEPLPGVAEIEVDFPNRIVTCKLDAEDFDSEKALAVLAETGFESTIRK